MRLNTLSGRFAVLTMVFVLLAEAAILIPSVANFRTDVLESHLRQAQIASLARLATDATLDSDLERELLENAGVYNVVLRRFDVRQLVLASPLPEPIVATYDLRREPWWRKVADSMRQLANTEDNIIRVIGQPVNGGGDLIEITLQTGPLRDAMVEFALQLLVVSAVFAVATAVILNIAAQRLILRPIRGVISNMADYANAPQDARSVIVPTAQLAEIRDAEVALSRMQTALSGALRQKDRLAQLGQAVAKISHDLRNILTTAQIFADRLEGSADPATARAAPKLIGSITRAVNLCETTLAFGRAEEPAPMLSRFILADLVDDVVEAETLASQSSVRIESKVPRALRVRADHEQLYRVLVNLARNARQAIEGTGQGGVITIDAGASKTDWWIRVTDTGPGLPDRARNSLFQPFAEGGRKGGSGLGLAIAAELIHGHGGKLTLEQTGPSGTTFCMTLPQGMVFESVSGVPAFDGSDAQENSASVANLHNR